MAMTFVKLHRRIDRVDINRYRDQKPILFLAVARIIAFGDSYTDGAAGNAMQPDGAWVDVSAGDCPGDDDSGEFRVTESAEEIAALIEEAFR